MFGYGRSPKKAKKAKRAKYSKTVVKKAKKRAPKSAEGRVSRVGTSATRHHTSSYWSRVKRELHILICTDDRKYEKLRRALGKQSKMTQVAIVSSISAAIGAVIGVAATFIGPFVTLGLMTLVQVGKNAWCTGQST
jgi:VIT1/CCC1 family predicted Fe2+/Mn2+ transporter